MKALLISFSMSAYLSIAHAGVTVLELKPDNAEEPQITNGDYTKQVIQKFAEVLEKSAELKKQFDAFETEAVGDEEERRGRYGGVSARGIVLHESEVVDFHARAGEFSTKDYTQTIVVHYSYNEGFRRGMESSSGVFAVFELKGAMIYKYVEAKDDHELAGHKVNAIFKGFTKTLTADKKEK